MPHIIILDELTSKLHQIRVYANDIAHGIDENQYSGQELAAAEAAQVSLEDLRDRIMQDYEDDIDTLIETQKGILGIGA